MGVTWAMPREPGRSENQIKLLFFFNPLFPCAKKQERNSSPTPQQAVLDFICFY